MTLSKIWVLAEAADGEVASTTLELLTKARELADTVECVYAGDDADEIAETLGEYGCETVHQTGDLDGALVGVPTAAVNPLSAQPPENSPATVSPTSSAAAT